jgi:hypothetical protein
MSTSAAARSKARVCGGSLAKIVGSNPVGDMDLCLSKCCMLSVEVSASGLSLIRKSPTECAVSECDREVSMMRVDAA